MSSRVLGQVRCRPGVQAPYPRCSRKFSSDSRSRQLPEASHFSDYPPEHPRYIDIPRPVQPQAVGKPIIKGRLPVPRPIFPPKGPSKTSPEFLAATTPEPSLQKLKKIPDERTREAVSFKQRQAEQRRQNFRQGIRELHERKKRVVEAMAARSSRIQASNQAARDAAEREDERLTKASILQSDLPAKKLLVSDLDRERSLAMKRERMTNFLSNREHQRKELLHELYVNAQDFITTSEQLDQAIDVAFDDMEQFKSSSRLGHNVWNFGQPDTTSQMLRKSRGNLMDLSIKAVDDPSRSIADERLKQLGEELTGGKS